MQELVVGCVILLKATEGYERNVVKTVLIKS